MKPTHFLIASAAMLLASTTPLSAQPPTGDTLGLEEAVRLAVEAEDPALARHLARADALEHEAVADSQLPDPQVSGQVANVPVDTFSFDQADMTQLRVGLRQQFPAGRTLAVRRDMRLAESRVEQARSRAEAARIARETRMAWLDAVHHEAAGRLLEQSRNRVQRQIDALASQFATGRLQRQDILRAELELSLIDDRLAEHRRQAELARASLARWIGTDADRPLPGALPQFDVNRELGALTARLVDHPEVAAADARIAAAGLGIELAEQAYRPALALEGGYGIRQDRADFASIGVTMSLPLFTDRRQDRERAAAVRRQGAEELERDALLLELKRQLEREWTNWRRLGERVDLYRSAVEARAAETAEATIGTYANRETDFSELIRSQLAELDLAVRRLELEVERARAWAQVRWLAGEPS
ncbi:MAG: TolC family protein [Wenzhouxiangellaceae bacterium]|nr:TolC family protein [Wenzhouxiangellaceae bacterium]